MFGNTNSRKDASPRADLRTMMAQQPLAVVATGMIDAASMAGDKTTEVVKHLLEGFNTALANGDANSLEKCFFPTQGYWKDQLALTYHLRTFTNPSVITAALLETKALRGITEIAIKGEGQFILATPNLPEDESLLHSAARKLDGVDSFETDVFIIGGGNAAIALAARLKALGVDSVMAERNARVGDNWALRYDCMRFHIPTSVCDLPYMSYEKRLRTPHLLSRDDLVSQVRRYVDTFNLNVVTSAKIQSTQYDWLAKRWIVKFQTPDGELTAVSKHLVQATGIGSQKPNLPSIPDRTLYQGISVHSAQYKNSKELGEKGVKSVLAIGSANTAFGILEDCHAAGLQTIMVVRSPTYIVPVEHICDRRVLGAYDAGVEAADNLFLTIPTVVDSQIARGLFAQLAASEPTRYAALASTGFPVVDSTHPDSVLMHNLLERGGGHYVDVGGTKLLAEGKAGVKAGVEPVAYTKTGLLFSDDSILDADAVVWCTGFADKDVRTTVLEILGDAPMNNEHKQIIGPREIANRVDATWGVDAEGEIRGMWKRQSKLDNFWVMGGHTQLHRWHLRTLALQIKAELEGILPPAYLETPVKTVAKM